MKWENLKRGDIVLSDNELHPSNIRLVLNVEEDQQELLMCVNLEILDLLRGRFKKYQRVGEMPLRYIVLTRVDL